MALNNFVLLSTGRSGTTTVSRLIEPLIRKSNIHQTQYSRRLNILSNIVLSGLFSKKMLCRLLYSKFTNSQEYISTADPLKSIAYTLCFAGNDLPKDLKIIHLIRDPRDFVKSFINWSNGSLRKKITHSFLPFWQPNPYFVSDISVLSFLKMSKFEHFCWIWNFKNQYFSDSFSKEKQYLILKFEDLINDETSHETIKNLFEFIGLNLSTDSVEQLIIEKSNSSSINNYRSWGHWSSIEAKKLDFWCGEQMRRYGYGEVV